jgi:hypothetical protein
MSEYQRAKRAVQAWFDGPEIARIDEWRRKQPEVPTWSAAMRELAARGLDAIAKEEEQGRAA